LYNAIFTPGACKNYFGVGLSWGDKTIQTIFILELVNIAHPGAVSMWDLSPWSGVKSCIFHSWRSEIVVLGRRRICEGTFFILVVVKIVSFVNFLRWSRKKRCREKYP